MSEIIPQEILEDPELAREHAERRTPYGITGERAELWFYGIGSDRQ